MVRRNSASFRFSLVAVLCGLSALFAMSAAYGRETVRHAGMSYADVAAPTFGIRSSREDKLVRVARPHRDLVAFNAGSLASGNVRHESHPQTARVLPRVSAAVFLFNAGCAFAPNFAESLLARENVLALGGAPRAPGPSRAPPAA